MKPGTIIRVLDESCYNTGLVRHANCLARIINQHSEGCFKIRFFTGPKSLMKTDYWIETSWIDKGYIEIVLD